jgi:hypothetical protein
VGLWPLAHYFLGQGNAECNTMAERTGFAGRNKSISMLASDQHGAVAFEGMIVYLFMGVSLFLPLADVAVAGLKYNSAWEALRAFGQYIQYNNPPDPTNPGTWKQGLQTTVAGYPISNLQVMCGDANAVCSSGNATMTLPDGSVVAAPKYFTFSTTVTFAPIILGPILCPSTGPCTYTLLYSERFQ